MPRVVKLKQKKDGGFYQRHRIPRDARAEYHRLYGKSSEDWFSTAPDVDRATAERMWKEWSAEVTTRIANIRAQRSGKGISLTRQQAYALAGQWYSWFVALHEANPGPAAHWAALRDALLERLEDYAPDWARKRGAWNVLNEWRQLPEVCEGMRPFIADEAKTAQFLATRGLTLSHDAQALFLDCVLDEFERAILVLERRANRIYDRDDNPASFPKLELEPTHKDASGLTPWKLFEAWVSDRPRKAATVDRWRAVFLDLEKHFKARAIGSITEDEAEEWARNAITEERSVKTVVEIWCNAARAVFNWAIDEKRWLSSNPFSGPTRRLSKSVPKKQRRRQEWFWPEEIVLILNAALAVTDTKRPFDAARRWVPWICAYTGARAGEITQLRGSDVVKRDGHWTIHITPEAGTVKTDEARDVPLHEHILEQGFVEFAHRSGKGHLFYNDDTPSRAIKSDPTNPAKPRWVRTRERLAEWVREIGVTDEDVQPNHAWRDTFQRIADRAGITEKVSDYITGHAPTNVARTYGAPSVDDMAEALKKFPRYDLSDRAGT